MAELNDGALIHTTRDIVGETNSSAAVQQKRVYLRY